MRETEIGEGGAWASTLWSTVLKARSGEGPEALDKLARRYWKPVYFYIRSKHRDIESAKDLTQSFFAYLLDKDLLQRVGPERGADRQRGRGLPRAAPLCHHPLTGQSAGSSKLSSFQPSAPNLPRHLWNDRRCHSIAKNQP